MLLKYSRVSHLCYPRMHETVLYHVALLSAVVSTNRTSVHALSLVSFLDKNVLINKNRANIPPLPSKGCQQRGENRDVVCVRTADSDIVYSICALVCGEVAVKSPTALRWICLRESQHPAAASRSSRLSNACLSPQSFTPLRRFSLMCWRLSAEVYVSSICGHLKDSQVARRSDVDTVSSASHDGMEKYVS